MAHIQNLQVIQPTAQASGPGNIGMGARRPQMPGGAGLMVAWVWLTVCDWLFMMWLSVWTIKH